MALLEAILVGLGTFIVAVGTLDLIRIVTLWLGDVTDWFRARFHLIGQNLDHIAFGIREAQRNGRVSYVQGVFDDQRGNVLASGRWDAESLGTDLRRIHGPNELAVYR